MRARRAGENDGDVGVGGVGQEGICVQGIYFM